MGLTTPKIIERGWKLTGSAFQNQSPFILLPLLCLKIPQPPGKDQQNAKCTVSVNTLHLPSVNTLRIILQDFKTLNLLRIYPCPDWIYPCLSPRAWEYFLNLWCSDYWKMHFPVHIFTHTPWQNSQPETYDHNQAEGNCPSPSRQHFFENLFVPQLVCRYCRLKNLTFWLVSGF